MISTLEIKMEEFYNIPNSLCYGISSMHGRRRSSATFSASFASHFYPDGVAATVQVVRGLYHYCYHRCQGGIGKSRADIE
jgi:hypothetical protein